MNASETRFARIDCLRAIAALSVLLHHLTGDLIRLTGLNDPVNQSIDFILYNYIDLGRFGVLLFFIISGYCIAHSILRPSPYPATTFAINRITRIFPAYWLSIAAAVIVYGPPSSFDLIANIGLLQGFLKRPDLIGVYWTLTIEISFYGFCILLFYAGILKNLRRTQIVWTALVIYCVFAAFMRGVLDVALPYAWPWFLALMIGGAILRRIDDIQPGDRPLIVYGVIGLLIAALGIAMNIYQEPSEYNKSWYRDYIANSLAIIAFIIGNYLVQLQSRILSYLGKISFSLYLFHPLVIETVSRMAQGYIDGSGLVGAAVMAGVVISCSVAIAAASYHFIELPGMQVGRWILNLLQRRSSTTFVRLLP